MSNRKNKDKHKRKKAILIRGRRMAMLRNEAPYAIRIENVTWPTALHYLLAGKHALSIDQVRQHPTAPELLAWIRDNDLPARYKWPVYRDERLLAALRAKFNQHLDLESILTRTGNAILVYVDPDDLYFGVDERGAGENWLGRMLMRVRREIGRPLIEGYFRSDEPPRRGPSPVVQSHPADVGRLVELAETYVNCAEWSLGLQAAKRAIETDADCEEGHRIVAWILILNGMYAEAVPAVRECLRLSPYQPQYYWWMSMVHERLGKTVPAMLFASRARKLEGGA